jgi:hypothetical protein
MAETDGFEEQKPKMITDMTLSELAQVMLAGLVAGAVAGGLTIALSMYLFKVTPCVAETCGTGGQYAAILAGIIAGAVALFWLMRVQIFRPLLVVIGVTISLWGVALYIFDMPWYMVVLISAGLHAVAYGLFAWVSRIRLFWIVIILLVLVVIAVRLILAN